MELFLHYSKMFTCGFVNTNMAMVGTLGLNVVDGRIFWCTAQEEIASRAGGRRVWRALCL